MTVINGYDYNVTGSYAKVHPTNRNLSSYRPPLSKRGIEVEFGRTITRYELDYSSCSKVKSLPEVPNGVTELICNNCTSLTSVNMVDTLTEISFLGCTKLETVPVIPASVETMDSCFKGCASLKGIIEINATNITSYTNCFKDTEKFIFLCGPNGQRSSLADTANNDNVEVFTAPAVTPTWVAPVTDRTATSRTNYADMNRIAGNLYLCGGYPYRTEYTASMFVTDIEWMCLVQSVNIIADAISKVRISDSTSYTNLNKLETILLEKHNS